MARLVTHLKATPKMKDKPATVTLPAIWKGKLKALVVLLFVFAGVLQYQSQLQRLPLETLSNLVSVIVIFILGYMILSDPRHVWSVPTTYFIVFCLFHFGATLSFGLGLSIPQDIEKGFKYWFYTPYTNLALFLSLVGFLACVAGVLFATVLNDAFLSTVAESEPSKKTRDVYLAQVLQTVGFLLLLISISAWLINVVNSGGYSLLVGSYSDYLDKAESSIVSYLLLGIAFGLPFLVIGPKSKLLTLGLLIFGIWALFAVPLGLRGEVLFPFCAAMALVAKKMILPSLKQTLILAVCLLTLISAVRQVRQYGLSNLANADIDTNPVGALYELGASLRPVSEVVKWQAHGEGFIYGDSYWAPFERLFERITLDPTRVSDQNDFRIMNVLIQKRVGPIGFSPVAEAYVNFDLLGVIIIMFLTGLLLSRLDSWAMTPMREAILAIIFVELLIQVRNDFVVIPFQTLLGLSIVYAALLLSKVLQKRTLPTLQVTKLEFHQS